MNGSRRARLASIAMVGVVLVGFAAACTNPAGVTPPSVVVYNSLVTPLPGNVVSTPMEAFQASEIGDEVILGGTARTLDSVTVDMSDWALQSDAGSITYCSGHPASCSDAGWKHDITLNIYPADHSIGAVPAAGPLLGTVSQTFTIPWKPAEVGCPDPTAYLGSDGNCYHGKAFTITFDLTALHLTVPSDIVWGIAYNTTDYGYHPLGGTGGPWDSLNVGTDGTGATVGTDAELDASFLNSVTPGQYGDLGAGGTGTFRRTTGVTGQTPNIEILAH